MLTLSWTVNIGNAPNGDAPGRPDASLKMCWTISNARLLARPAAYLESLPTAGANDVASLTRIWLVLAGPSTRLVGLTLLRTLERVFGPPRPREVRAFRLARITQDKRRKEFIHQVQALASTY